MKKQKTVIISNVLPRVGIYLLALLSFLYLSNIIPLSAPPALRITISAAIILFLPGFILSNIFLKKKINDLEIPEKIANYFLFSMIFLLIIVLTAYTFKLEMGLVNQIILAVISLLALTDILLAIIRKEKIRIKLPLHPLKIFRPSWKRLRNITIIIAGLALSFLSYKAMVHLGNDSLVHLSIIRKMIENGISPQNPFFRELGDILGYTYALWQPVVGIVSKLGNIDPLYTWNRLSILIIPLALFSAYFFAKNLLKNRNAAFICAMVVFYFISFLNFANDTNAWDVRTFIYPRNIALFILLPLFFGWLFKFINLKQSRKTLTLLITILFLSAATTAATHLFYFFLIIISLLAFSTLHLIIHKKQRIQETKKIILILVLTLLIAIPYYLTLAKTGITPIKSADNTSVMSSIFLFPGTINWGVQSILSPVAYLVLTPLLLLWFRKKTWAIFLASLMILTPLLYLIPPFATILGMIIGSKITRIYQIAPIYYLTGFFIWWFVSHLKNNLKKATFKKATAVIIIITIAFLISPWSRFCNKVDKITRVKKGQICLNSEEVDFLNSLEKRSIIAASSIPSKNITALSPHYVVCINNLLRGFGEDKAIGQREEDNSKIISPNTNIKKTISLLKKYKADYILIKKDKDQKFKQGRMFFQVYTGSSFNIYQLKDSED